MKCQKTLAMPTKTTIILTKEDTWITKGGIFDSIPDLKADPPPLKPRIMPSGAMMVSDKQGRCYIFFRNYHGKAVKTDIPQPNFEKLEQELLNQGAEKLIN